MNQGRIVELGSRDQVFGDPQDDYTKTLLAAVPRINPEWDAQTPGEGGLMTSYTIPGMHVREHTVEVPLDWAESWRRPITVFARELVDPVRKDEDLPCLLFLQGGPGGKAPRPIGPTGWIGQALKTHRVILLDQRGTGRSYAGLRAADGVVGRARRAPTISPASGRTRSSPMPSTCGRRSSAGASGRRWARATAGSSR